MMRPLNSIGLYLGLLAMCSTSFGQQPAQQGGVPRVANVPPPVQGQNAPQGGPQVEMKISPQVEAILQTWEQKTSDISRMKGKYRRYVYDHIFLVEKRAYGEYWFESPDKARMDFYPDKELPNPPQQKIGSKVFQIQADRGETWLCTGKEILDINHDEKTYDRFQIPVAFQGQNITNGPLPFLFGMKAEEVKKKYMMSLGDMHKPEEGKIHIVATPMVPALRREFQRAEILLNAETYLPSGVKLWDPAGSKETVYVFWEPERNFRTWLNDPFRINLRGWKLINDHKAPADENNREARQPNGVMIK